MTTLTLPYPPSGRSSLPAILARVTPLPDGCWTLRGETTRLGYVRVWASNHRLLGHRYTYEALVGPVGDGLSLDHRCRVRACCNPEHLQPVTHAENCQRKPLCKLTPGDVAVIRETYARGNVSTRALGVTYGVSKTMIRNIILRRSWA